jgi:hypothetical protein
VKEKIMVTLKDVLNNKQTPLYLRRTTEPLADPLALLWALEPGNSNDHYIKVVIGGISRKTYYDILKADKLTAQEYKRLMGIADQYISQLEELRSPHAKHFRHTYNSFDTPEWRTLNVERKREVKRGRRTQADTEAH